MIGRGELRGGEDVNSISNACFSIYCSFKGIFVLKRSFKKKNGQVLNKPQVRLLLKLSGGTFYQIYNIYIIAQKSQSKFVKDQ